MDIARIARLELVDEEVAAWLLEIYGTRVTIGSLMTPDIMRGLSSAWAARDLPSD